MDRSLRRLRRSAEWFEVPLSHLLGNVRSGAVMLAIRASLPPFCFREEQRDLPRTLAKRVYPFTLLTSYPPITGQITVADLPDPCCDPLIRRSSPRFSNLACAG